MAHTISLSRTLVGLAFLISTIGTMADSNCPALSVNTCALPFPSNHYLISDSAGLGVSIPDSVVRAEAYGAFPASTRPTEVFADADGYGSSTPVIFELKHDLMPGSIARNGGNLVAVYNANTGERVPIVIDFDKSRSQTAGADNLITVVARARYDYEQTFVAVVYGDVPTQNGQSAALNNSDVTQWANDSGFSFVDSLITQAMQSGRGIAGGTIFTIRSKHNTRFMLEDMVATARQQEHKVNNIFYLPNPGADLFGSSVDMVVFGNVEVTDFRDPSTGKIDWYPGSPGRKLKVPFVLALPKNPAGPQGAPVAIYGHGVGAVKETMIVVSEDNAHKGVATLSIDKPLHGIIPWFTEPEPQILQILDPSNLERVTAMTFQSVVHHISALEAIKDTMRHWDSHPVSFPPWWKWWEGPTWGDGKPDINADVILYQGTSLGGVLGSAFVANAPEIKDSLLQVPGVGIMNILLNSDLWEGQFSNTIPAEANPSEQAFFVAMASHIIDSGDATNYVERFAEQDQNVLVAYAEYDGIVYNRASERMLELMEIPIYREVYQVPHLPYINGGQPRDGHGAMQFQGIPAQISELHGANHGIWWLYPQYHWEHAHWLNNRLDDSGYGHFVASLAASGGSHCSGENGYCTVPNGVNATVWYGANNNWSKKSNVTGGIACNNGVFGDPAYGTAKSCRYNVQCANENGFCSIPNNVTANVWYGANNKWIKRGNVYGGIACNNATFGDPIPGTVKSCMYTLD